MADQSPHAEAPLNRRITQQEIQTALASVERLHAEHVFGHSYTFENGFNADFKCKFRSRQTHILEYILQAFLDNRIFMERKDIQPTHFTMCEGGEWYAWDTKFREMRTAHSIRFTDGSVFDMVNGWRPPLTLPAQEKRNNLWHEVEKTIDEFSDKNRPQYAMTGYDHMHGGYRVGSSSGEKYLTNEAWFVLESAARAYVAYMNTPKTAHPDTVQHWRGIGKLIEEQGELLQLLGKAIVFPVGPHPDGKGELRTRLPDEIDDVIASIGYFREVNGLRDDTYRAAEKLVKYRKWGLTGVVDLNQISYNIKT